MLPVELTQAFDSGCVAAEVFTPCPNLSDEINHNIIQSESEGGVYLRDLDCGTVLTIETQDWTCTLVCCEERKR